MATESHQAPLPSFDILRIVNALAVDGVDSTGRIKDLDCWYKEEWRGWGRRVQDLETKCAGSVARAKRMRSVMRMG